MKKVIVIGSLLMGFCFGAQAQQLSAKQAIEHIGNTATVCGKIYGGRYFDKNDKTLLNMGAAYPNHLLTIVIEGVDRKKFSGKPEEMFLEKEICVTGLIRDFKGRPELQVTEVTQIVLSKN